jgi:hypothetical protein
MFESNWAYVTTMIFLPIYLHMKPISYKIDYQGETKY